jgi:outer membrane translocation and assembly module TamA
MKTFLPALLMRLVLTSLLCNLVGVAAGAQSQSTTRSMPATAYKLISVKVTGTKRFAPEEVAAASGVPVGTIAHEEDFRKAARQLGESGAFSNIAFTFSYSAAGTKLEFQVTRTHSPLQRRVAHVGTSARRSVGRAAGFTGGKRRPRARRISAQNGQERAGSGH